MKKVLIIGSGQIGRALEHGLQGVAIDVWPGDLDELSRTELERVGPDVVINAAGKTNLAWCEANAAEAVRCNLEAPVRLYERILAMPEPPRFLQFSSGCIWDGPYDANGEPFTPSSPANPAVLYSWTKAACDAMLLARDADRVAIVRPRQVYSADPNDRNMLVKLTRYPGLVDTPNSISSIATIVHTIQHLLDAKGWTGTWNVYDRGIVTPYEIASMLAKAGLRKEPSIITKDELDAFHRPRRVDTVLYDARFEAAIDPPDAREELLRAIEGLKEHVRAEPV